MKGSRLALVLCLIFIPLVMLAQGEPGWNKSSLGANFELSVPVGTFADVAGTGYGGNLRYQIGTDIRTVFTATVGYIVWGTKDLGANTSIQPKAFNFFVGGKYYLAKGFYGSLEGGAYFYSYSYTGNVVGAEGNTTRFMLPIGIGFQTSGFELGARYMLLATYWNCFSFTVGYNFIL